MSIVDPPGINSVNCLYINHWSASRINSVDCFCIDQLYIGHWSPLHQSLICPPGSTVSITSVSIACALIIDHLYINHWSPPGSTMSIASVSIASTLIVDCLYINHWSTHPPQDQQCRWPLHRLLIQRKLFYLVLETIHVIIRLNSWYSFPYCWLRIEKVPADPPTDFRLSNL